MDNNSDSDSNDILSDLLANNETTENENPAPKKTLEKLDFNFLDSECKATSKKKASNLQDESNPCGNGIDSSDDEDNRYFQEQKYSDYGRDIKSLLKKDTCDNGKEKPLTHKSCSTAFSFDKATKYSKDIDTLSNRSSLISKDVYSDPFFGLRIINPIISSADLKARMNGKTAVPISKVKHHVNSERTENDWVIAGVLINKSTTKTSQKGTSYAIWKISDLSESMNTITLFMFSSAYKILWKTNVGTVIAILNPNIMESKDQSDLATLSADNPQKVMILGKSKDMGTCRSIKKNGEPCNNIVNITRCEFCIYHVKQEYKKCSRRSELQAFSNTQQFSIDMLKSKGQPKKPLDNNMSFNPVYAVKNEQLEAKNAKRLALLSGISSKTESSNGTKSLDDVTVKSAKTELESQQKKNSFAEMSKSRGWKAAVLMQQSSNIEVLSRKSGSITRDNTLKKNSSTVPFVSLSPRLGTGCIGGTIDLSAPITKRHIKNAKSNAIKWVKENGRIAAKDPNKVRLNKEEKVENTKKRPREEHCEEQEIKKSKSLADKFTQMMEAKSAHTDLIDKSYEEEKEKYFNKLEIKERMEEKMLTTYKVACKAVKCLICKYTSFSASDLCKEQKHPLRVADATKRFFRCADCGNRTVSLDRIPSHSCIKCSSSNWTRAAMMDERKTNIPVATLSIRGDEESYIGASAKEANLNLLVPENDGK